jgi:hypothetical protein
LKPQNIFYIFKKIIIVFYFLSLTNFSLGWGFCAHRHINRYATFTLPQSLFQFYKYYLGYITEHAIDPDKRRSIDFSEKEKHFIDLDFYLKNKDCTFEEVLENFLQDEDRKHGILPLNIVKVKFDLTNAFRELDIYKIVKLSTDLGHYIGDLNVPLHTTSNYDGQRDGQEGVHALWETRLPELFHKNYKYFAGKASYLKDPLRVVWQTVLDTHKIVEELLMVEKETSEKIKIGTHSYENKNSYAKKVFSRAYAQEFNGRLMGQVEEQILKSVKMLGDFWFSCWVDAGSPDLSAFTNLQARKRYFVVTEENFFDKDKEDDDYGKNKKENSENIGLPQNEEDSEYCEMK